ncbi:hypothetical protein [Methylococcus capsulatus]|uniref:SIR2-like domain-containing protein n=1 Tax=Methylococcus capsulatus TaxID=414 RepID=A0AA35UAX7_METCP|nr:hypothetical protein [Methylococcus capsulatus]CAI8771049.1 conserved protein of unknown function [Methylococcus capsulatus]
MLLITGAGVDRTPGIDFPLANTLLADVTRYLDGPGKTVDEALRDMLPGLRFSFNTMIARAVDKIATREPHEQKAMVQRVQVAIADLPAEKEAIRKHGELIIRLFNKLATIAEQSQLDEETEQLIREVFPMDADELIDSDSILDIHKLSLSDTFKTVLKRTLKMGLSGDRHEVASALGADMLNIETLLVEKFLGFYNDRLADIKNYLYIAWSLWAYLVAKQNEVLAVHEATDLPFYGGIPDGVRAITLNYTAFLQHRLGADRTLYFHGGLADYVRMDTRDLLPIENIHDRDPAEFIRNYVAPNVDVAHEDLNQQRHVIPALVPPLRLKPILSHRYIELWSKASAWVRESKHIVVVGYSFNNADEHFNDILRCHPDRNIDIVVPEATSPEFIARMEKIFGTATNQYNKVEVNGHDAMQAKRVRLIAAKAADVDLTALLEAGM